MVKRGGKEEAPEEESSDDDPPPSLTPAEEPGEVTHDRPAWVDVPGTVERELMAADDGQLLFGFHLHGGAVTENGVQIGFLSAFLDRFRKIFEPLQVVPTGRIPEGNRLPDTSAFPTNVAALAATGSVTIWFSLGAEEAVEAAERGQDEFDLLTVKAVGHLGALLNLDPSDPHLIENVEPFGRRIGKGYAQLSALLAEHRVAADWWSDLYVDGVATAEPAQSEQLAERLLRDELYEPYRRERDGFVWDVATGASDETRFVQIASGSQRIKASYAVPLTKKVTDATSRMVSVRLIEHTYRYPFAVRPHRRTWELIDITDIGEPAGALKEAEEASEE